jgi:iron complex transport system substrate-binding protein
MTALGRVLLLLTAAVAGCSAKAPPGTTRPAAATARLLSAAPNITEICCALGLRERLVGRTRYCDYPPEIGSLPSIGALNDLNVEALLALKPDLVLVSGHSRAITDRLAPLGLRMEAVPDTSLEDLFVAVERIGELADCRAAADTLSARLRSEIDTVAARQAGRPPARVLIVTAPLSDPPEQPVAAGPGSFYDDLLRRAGHTNVAAAAGRPFAPVALEFVLRSDPDVIVELVPDAAGRPGGATEARQVWAKLGPLQAVRFKRVYTLVGARHFVLGPRVVQTFEELCRLISDDGHE